LYYYGARYYDPRTSIWQSVDPMADKYASSSPYDFTGDNPITRIDPSGKNWFYYQAKNDKARAWHWQKGNKATYINSNGKKATMTGGYRYLVTFTYDRGHTTAGGKRGTLTLYDQDKVLKSSTAFSGAGWWAGGFDETAPGNYKMHLNPGDRTVMSKNSHVESNDAENPPATMGMQKIEDGTIITRPDGSTHSVNSDYGNYRIRLHPTDGSRDRGLYLHGKDAWYNSRTHGCTCEKDEIILEYIWEHQEIKGIVPFAVDQPITTIN
ncbi:MAG TPA: RHS repeat-associated core domain-containing protein, partial [Puia sp.]|nr:RHS repeat-associated core domain-containing protein [Puia sp.]